MKREERTRNVPKTKESKNNRKNTNLARNRGKKNQKLTEEKRKTKERLPH